MDKQLQNVRGRSKKLWRSLHILPVKVSNGHNFTTHVVIQSVDRVGVDEAVSDPLAGLDNLLNLQCRESMYIQSIYETNT